VNLSRGDIVLVDFDPALKNEAASTRPAILVTNNAANELSPTLVVVPLTSNVERVYPFEILLKRSQTGLDYDSKVQIQFIRHVSRARLKRVIGSVLKEDLLELDGKLREHLAL
jgi:mRNA interferase MazF